MRCAQVVLWRLRNEVFARGQSVYQTGAIAASAHDRPERLVGAEHYEQAKSSPCTTHAASAALAPTWLGPHSCADERSQQILAAAYTMCVSAHSHAMGESTHTAVVSSVDPQLALGP